MNPQDAQLPEPRNADLPPAVEPTRGGSAAAQAATPRVGDLHALLGDLHALRTTLQTDLSFAAAALEAGSPALAKELVAGNLDELHAFESRALGHLRSLEDQVPAGERAVAQVPPTVPAARRRRWRLPAAPLVAAAAALVGFALGVVPDRILPDTPARSISSAAVAGYELNRLAQAGAPVTELRAAAQELNDELTELIAIADDDPQAAEQAWVLLRASTAILSQQSDQGSLRAVLLRTGELETQLRQLLAVVPGPVVDPLANAVNPRPERTGQPVRGLEPMPQPSREAAAATDRPTAAPETTSPPTPATTADAPASAPTASNSPAATTTAPTSTPELAPRPLSEDDFPGM